MGGGGLGLIPFESKKFKFDKTLNLKVPHMGWDIVAFKQKSPLLDGTKMYMVFSFIRKKVMILACLYCVILWRNADV